jgi:hypothetical protein
MSRPASWSRVPSNSPTRTSWHRHPWLSDGDWYADTAQRIDSWQIGRGWLRLDDEDSSYHNHNAASEDLYQRNNFVWPHGNTECWLARVRCKRRRSNMVR